MSILVTVFLIGGPSVAQALTFYDFAPVCKAMATRQLRISDAHQIRQQLRLLVGKKINIVLRDGTAALGVLKTSTDQEVEILNMAQKCQRYAVSAIVEIYIDSLV